VFASVSSGVSDRGTRLIIEREMGRFAAQDFDRKVKAASCSFYAGDPQTQSPVSLDAIAAISCRNAGIERYAGKKIHTASTAQTSPICWPRTSFRHPGQARQARARSVPVLRPSRCALGPGRCLVIEDSVPASLAARAAGMPCWFPRRQPLSAGPRQTAPRCRGDCDV